MGDAELSGGQDGGYDLGLVVTETMADLYASQGLTAQAAEVYRELLRARPEDSGLQAKLTGLSRGSIVGQSPRGDAPASEIMVEQEPAESAIEPLVAAATAASEWSEEPTPAPVDRLGAPVEHTGRTIGGYLRELLAFGRADTVLAPSPEEGDGVLLLDESMVVIEGAPDQPSPSGALVEDAEVLYLDESMVVTEATPDQALPDAAPVEDTEILYLDESMVVAEGTEAVVAPPLAETGGGVGPGLALPSASTGPSAAPADLGDAAEEDDEDLEVFRSWLRNLKR
jgi:hypothetical protein